MNGHEAGLLAKPYQGFFERLLQALQPLLVSGRSLFVYPHVRADGDALGSSSALAAALAKLGFETRVILEEAPLEQLNYLPLLSRFASVYEEADRARLESEQGAALLIDCHSAERLGRRALLLASAAPVMVLDHHILLENKAAADLALIDPRASSSCELVTALMVFLEEREKREILDPAMALSLMTGLLTDTGRFCFSNTRTETFLSAAWLLRFPLDLKMLSLRLFDELSQAKLRLSGYVQTHARFHYGQRLLIATLPYSIYRQFAAVGSDTEGLSGNLRDVRGVEVAILLRENDDGSWKASVRSGTAFDAALYAQSFGGGGHVRAAGFTLPVVGEEEAQRRCVEAAGRFLEGVERGDE